MKHRIFSLGILLLLTVAAFRHACHSGYLIWDDNVFIQENPILKLPFSQAVNWAFGRFYFSDYLPVTLMSYWAEIAAFGYDPAVQHISNLILHLLNVCLLAELLRELFGDSILVVIVCSFFAIHPVQTEAVMWIAERKGLLNAFFTLSALLAARFSLTGNRKMESLAGYYICFLLGLLSKMSAFLLPLWLMAWEMLADRRRLKPTALRHALPLCLAFGFAVLRLHAFAEMDAEAYVPTWEMSRLAQLPLQAANALGFYIRLFFWPFHLSIIYPRYEFAGDVPINVLVLALFTACAGWAILRDQSRRVIAGGLGLFLFPLIPVLQIIPRNNYVNDRYLYFPIIGLAIVVYTLVRIFLQRFEFSRSVAFRYAGWGLLCSCLLPLSMARSAVWSSNESLWRDTVEKNPANALAWLNLGIQLEDQHRYLDAIESYKKASDLGTPSKSPHWPGTIWVCYIQTGSCLIFSICRRPRSNSSRRCVCRSPIRLIITGSNSICRASNGIWEKKKKLSAYFRT